MVILQQPGSVSLCHPIILMPAVVFVAVVRKYHVEQTVGYPHESQMAQNRLPPIRWTLPNSGLGSTWRSVDTTMDVRPRL